MRYNFKGYWYTSERVVTPNDARRHRSRCKYSMRVCKKYYCRIIGDECRGAAFCRDYEISEPKVLVLNRDKPPKGVYYGSEFVPKALRQAGTAVKHKIFGFGTVVSSDLYFVEVDFYTNGEKRRRKLAIDYCLKKNILTIYDYK